MALPAIPAILKTLMWLWAGSETLKRGTEIYQGYQEGKRTETMMGLEKDKMKMQVEGQAKVYDMMMKMWREQQDKMTELRKDEKSEAREMMLLNLLVGKGERQSNQKMAALMAAGQGIQGLAGQMGAQRMPPPTFAQLARL